MNVELQVLVLFCSLVSLSYSQTVYSYSFLNNGTCQTIELGQCIPCQYYTGYPIYYYQLQHQENYYTSALIFEDSACTDQYSWASYSDERCFTNSGGNCEFFIQVASVSALSLTLTSTDDIVVQYIGEEEVYSQLSSNKLIAQGADLTGVQIHSAGKNFFVERQLSDTQYSSSVGVFSFGETYTRSPFTFTVTQSVVNIPPTNFDPADKTAVNFETFFNAQVTNDNVFPTYTSEGGQIMVFVDSDYSLDGLVLSNPYYTVVNMTLYSPFSNPDYGNLVFQFERSSSPFLTVECYHQDTSLGNGNTQETYFCDVGSITGYFGSFYSFSLVDEFGEPKNNNKPDDMAFTLF